MIKSVPLKQDFIITFKKDTNSFKNFGNFLRGISLSCLEVEKSKIYILKTEDQIITIPNSHINRLLHLSYN